MRTAHSRLGLAAMILAALIGGGAAAQEASPCVENSPERRGEVGCSIIESKPLPEGLQGPLFWHLDRFDSPDLARAAAGPAAVAFEAAGRAWLMTIEPTTSAHHGGQHVTEVGPLPLSPAPRYSMEVRSSLFAPGMYSAAHRHSGVEVVYVIEGEACYETRTAAVKLLKGETAVIPADTLHRAVATGSTLRHVLSVNLHDSAKTATVRWAAGDAKQLVSCR